MEHGPGGGVRCRSVQLQPAIVRRGQKLDVVGMAILRDAPVETEGVAGRGRGNRAVYLCERECLGAAAFPGEHRNAPRFDLDVPQAGGERQRAVFGRILFRKRFGEIQCQGGTHEPELARIEPAAKKSLKGKRNVHGGGGHERAAGPSVTGGHIVRPQMRLGKQLDADIAKDAHLAAKHARGRVLDGGPVRVPIHECGHRECGGQQQDQHRGERG